MDEFFQVLPQWKVIVCRICQDGVWPDFIAGHLKGPAHYMSHRQAIEIQRQSAGLDVIRDPSKFEPVQQLVEPIPELRIYPYGWRCTAEATCQYTALAERSIKNHCARQHPGRRRRGYRQDPSSHNPWTRVRCQRFFTHRQGSNFFSVGVPEPGDPIPIDAVAEAQQRAQQAQQAVHDRTLQAIQDREEGTEFIPWLETMGWPTYLAGIDRKELMQLVETPDPEQEPLVAIIWEAMGDMLQHCQQTTKEQAGYFLRIEVVRSEARQTKYRPLQPYMDPKAMKDYARPWKQIVAFFVRTRGRENEGPKYQFQRREQECFRKMMRKARRIRQRRVHREGRDRPGSSGSSSGSMTSHTVSSNRSHPSIRLIGLAAACLRFCIALLARRCRGHEYELPIVCAMAVLAVKPQGWRSASEYPPIMSHIIKMNRFMVIQMAYQQVDEDHEYVEEEEPDLLRLVTKMVDQFMIRGSQVAMQWILDRRAYGMKIHMTSTAAGYIDWVGDQIRYKQMEFTMDQLRGMIHGLVQQAREALAAVLDIGEDEFPPIPWGRLRDDPTREGIGHSFVQDERNPWPVEGRSWLMNRLIDRGTFRQRGEVMSTRRITAWLEKVDRFKALMLVCVQIVWGQPARGPEILSMCYSHSGQGAGRNVFIAGGWRSGDADGSAVELVTRYHKGYNISGDIKIIHRFVPRAVGALMVWDAWLVTPAVETFQEIREPGSGGRQWRVWLSDHRGREWTPARMSREIQQCSAMALGEGVMLQSWRDISIAISRKYLRKGEGRFGYDEEDWDEEGEGDEVEDMQAGHGTHIAGTVYARGIREQDGVVESMRQKYRQASENWHRFLGFDDHSQQPGEKRKRTGWEDDAEEGRRERWKRIKEMDLDRELKRMMGTEEARFRGHQKEIIEAIVQGESRVLAVMPTGGGKSLLFMLPAFCGGGGVTIVSIIIGISQDGKE